MTRYLVLYLAAATVFLPLDMAWLGLIARDFYQSRLGPLLLDRPQAGVAFLFYAIYLAGIVIFAMGPALAAGSWRTALLYGALFGFFAYATYDLTNLATLKGFPLSVALVDMAWGTVLTGISASLGFLVASSFIDVSSAG